MKLFFAPGTCSLSPHIVALEAGIPLALERVDIRKTPRLTDAGVDYTAVNPNGYVPALQLNDSSVLTEGAAIVQYLADLKPEAGLIPPAGSAERYRCIAWLNFIATELHKMYSPWLFHPEYGAEAQDIARAKIRDRLAHVERTLVQGGPFLMGETFTVADAYLFTVVGWSHVAKVDLTPFPRLGEFIALVRARPTVRAALEAEARIAKRRHVA